MKRKKMMRSLAKNMLHYYTADCICNFLQLRPEKDTWEGDALDVPEVPASTSYF